MNSKIYKLFALAVVALTLFSFKFANASNMGWEPEFRFPGTFFPAFAIAAAGKDEKGITEMPGAIGFLGSSSLGVKVVNIPAGARVKVMVAIPEIGVVGDIELLMPASQRPTFILPRLSWSQSKLLAISQPISADALFKVFVDGRSFGEEKRPVRIRAINDSPLSVCKGEQQCADFSPYFAAFVNENHPVIDQVLRAALDIPAISVKRWVGTQGTEEDVLKQVWAIWYLFQRKKMTYSSITTVSDHRAEIHSQMVRPLSQTLRNAQANCIDGTALLASVLRKIGIEPNIILIPGHAFLSFYTGPNRTKPVYLETTMLNSKGNPFYERELTKEDVESAKAQASDPYSEQSWKTFEAALAQGQKTYLNASENFISRKPGYKIISIERARASGIQPLGL
jgi:hypothetical protein